MNWSNLSQKNIIMILKSYMKIFIRSKLIKLYKVINIMQSLISKRYSDKSSHSSIKLPPIQRRLSSHNSSKVQLKPHEISQGSIILKNKISKERKNYLRPSSINQKAIRYTKEKSKSRAEPLRMKTQNVVSSEKTIYSPQGSSDVGQLDKTLKDFKKYIQKNKQHINSQINKRIYLNRNSEKNIGAAYHKPQKRKNRLLNKNNLSSETEIFNQLHQLIKKRNDAICTIDLGQVEQRVRIVKLANNLRKLSAEKSITDIKADLLNEMETLDQSVKIPLKHQNNYHEWRRVNMFSPQQQPFYSQSTFDIQNQRLSQLTLQTQSSISRYLQNRKQMLQLKVRKFKTSPQQ